MSRRCLNLSQKEQKIFTPKCWSHTSKRNQLCGMRLQWDDGNKVMMMHFDTTLPPPTHPTKDSICLDIFSNIRCSPKLCLWAFNRKLEETHENFVPGSFAVFCDSERIDYMKSHEGLDDDHYKHLVLETYAGMLGDPNYINTIGSKTVVKPLGAIAGLSMKMEQSLQWTMVRPDVKEHEREVSFADRTH